MIFQLALRNLGLHRAKSLLVASIMGFAVFLLFVGNSCIDTAIQGLERLYVKGFTGNIMVTGHSNMPVTIFATSSDPLSSDELGRIENFLDLKSWLEAQPEVASLAPQISGSIGLGIGETVSGMSQYFGVDPELYQKSFPHGFQLITGAWPDLSQEQFKQGWIMLSENGARMLRRVANTELGPGDKIVISSISGTNTVIRELPIAAIIRFSGSNPELSNISLIDADTARDLQGFASLRDKPVTLNVDQAQFVSNFNPDDLFAEAEMITTASNDLQALTSQGRQSTDQVENPEIRDPSWQFMLILTKDGADVADLMGRLQNWIAEHSKESRVQTWVEGAGTVASLALMIRTIFDFLLVLIAVLVMIVTMNALAVSVAERIGEIGTMRAIGAKRRFVRRLILSETLILSAFSGLIALALGSLLVVLLGQLGIAAPNLFMETLFAGPVLKPLISLGAAIKALILIVAVSFLSVLYPVQVAMRISPVKAMSTE